MAPSNVPEPVSDSIKQQYVDILRANGIVDEVESVTAHEPEELKGEHMATGSMYVHVDFKDPSTKPKNLFVKYYFDNPGHKEVMKEMQVMEKETNFYMEFLPDAREFCRKFSGCENNLDSFPKCLYGDDEIMVLENVVLDDTFVMLRKEEYQDLDTAKFVLANLAKFHASNAAMIEEEGREIFRNKYKLLVREVMISENNNIMGQMFDGALNNCISILKGNDVEGSSDVAEKLSSYVGKAIDMVKETLAYNPKDKLHVINHGDFWNNNMLFKREPETGKVTEHLFIDLQCTRMCSPNLDIGYFLYTSVKPAVRRNHLKELLQHYFETFQTTLEAFGKNCPLTFEEFFEDYRKKFLLGFFIGLNVVCGMEAMKDIDMNDLSPDDPNGMADLFTRTINKWIKNNPDRTSEISKDIVKVYNEFSQLTSNQ